MPSLWKDLGREIRIGYIDGRLKSNERLPEHHAHYSKCFDARAATGFIIPLPRGRPLHETRLDFARVSTHYSTYYRIVPRRYFIPGDRFPENWADDERKRSVQQRYSPVGTIGHYLGCSFDAAIDEALFFTNGSINQEDYILLTIEAYFDELLYIANFSVLSTVLAQISIEANGYETMLKILDPNTSNDTTNKIGLWAREKGFKGIVYPSARFGQQQDIAAAAAAGKKIIPMINHICINSRMDFTNITSVESVIFNHELNKKGIDIQNEWYPVYAELNVVLFSGEQLLGTDRAIFWQTCPLSFASAVAAEDVRLSREMTDQYVDRDGSLKALVRERANRAFNPKL